MSARSRRAPERARPAPAPASAGGPAAGGPAAGLPAWVRAGRPGDGLLVAVQVVPGASRSRVLGPHEGRLRVSVAAPPERGRANEELVDLLAGLLGVPRRSVAVVRGTAARRKEVRIDSGDPVALVARLLDVATRAGPSTTGRGSAPAGEGNPARG